GYRVPRQILDFASLLLPRIAPGLAPARSLRQDPGSAAVVAAAPADLASLLTQVCADALGRPGSAALIAADAQVGVFSRMLGSAGVAHEVLDGAGLGARLTLVPVTLAKGLEFDHVIVAEPAEIVAAHSHGLHHLYVALTRAVSRLTVLHTAPLPEPLRSAADGLGALPRVSTP
ncbi:MAG TPA: ATP-binding domain-containing protein, partial [Streptosporangiaceae bacterium]|nr:ATP-binding domain-containing protein [Streptosporangiaceae bacterium]